MTPAELEDLLAACVVSIIALGTILPIARAYAKRLSQPNAAAAQLRSREDSDRLDRMERAIEAIAVEVERVAESQRFLTRLLASGEGERAVSLPESR